MGVPGRKPKPNEIKELAGNPGKRPLNNSPKPRPVAPKMPRGILPPEARKLWREVVPKLERLGVVTEVDGPALLLMCLHYAMAVRAARTLKDAGITVRDTNGVERKHPALQILRDNSSAWRQYAEQFGLTPSARSRLNIPEPEDADEFFGF